MSAGQPALFAEAVADDCDWTQMGAHPLAQRYRSKHAYFEARHLYPILILLHTVVYPRLFREGRTMQSLSIDTVSLEDESHIT